MSTQELVTSIVAEQEESTDQFLSIIQQKIEDAIEVKRIELASQMFAESKGECPECGKAKGDCECEGEEEDEEDDEEDDEEEDDKKEMKEGYEEDKKNAPFAGPYRKASEPRKDKYGNVVKNRAAFLAKLGRAKAEKRKMDEAYVIHKGKHAPGAKSSLGGQTLHGVSVKDVYTDKKEAQAHADKINAGRGYSPEDHKNSLYAGVLYQVSPAKKMSEEVEQIDEISKKAKAAYMGTAVADLASSAMSHGEDRGRRRKPDPELARRIKVRQLGIYRATKDMRKEEVEQVEEALGTAAKYADKTGLLGDKYKSSDRLMSMKNMSKIRDKRLADKNAEHEKQDPRMASMGYAKHMVDVQKAINKAEKRGVDSSRVKKRSYEYTNGLVQGILPEEVEQVQEVIGTTTGYSDSGPKVDAATRKAHQMRNVVTKGPRAGKITKAAQDRMKEKIKARLNKEEIEQVAEKAPPGAKYERMVKHIKKGYSKDGLTKREKAIAYATAWKAKNKEMSEAAMSDAQQMTALGMKGAEKAKTMTALTAYRKHGDINKLSAGHRSLLAGYMEKTGGLAAVNRGTAAQALKKERMQEE